MADKDLLLGIGVELGGLQRGLSGALGMIKRFAVGVLSVTAAARAFRHMTNEAIVQEKQLALLRVAVAGTADGSSRMAERMREAAGEMSMLSGYADDELVGALQKLVNMTGSSEAAMKALQPAVEMSIAKQMDLGAAANLVGRAYMNGSNVLRKYLTGVKDNVKGQQLLDLVTNKFRGTLDAYGETAEGRMKKARTSIDELSATLGTTMLPAIGNVAKELKDTVTWWDRMFKKMEERGKPRKHWRTLLREQREDENRKKVGVPGQDYELTEQEKRNMELEALFAEDERIREEHLAVLQALMPAAQELGAGIARAMAGDPQGLKDALKSMANSMIDLLLKMLEAKLIVDGLINWAALPLTLAAMGALGGVRAAIASMAEGGVAYAPTLAVVGDARTPEVVAPLHKLRPMIADAAGGPGRRGGTYNIHVHSDGLTDTAAIDRVVRERLVPAMARHDAARGRD